jgi:4-carboxymuconolactone decarboxylase
MSKTQAYLSGAALVAVLATGTHLATAQTPHPALGPAVGPASDPANWPADVDKKSGFRLPLPDRESLDETGKKSYDRGTKPGASLAGLQGPSGLRLYSPKTADASDKLNRYLRFEAEFTPRLRETIILATAREMDSQFEWVAHEAEGLKEGIPPAVIDIIKRRLPTAGAGIDATDAVIIDLVRELWKDHKVKPETFARAKAIFGPTRLIELVMLSGNYAATAALLSVVDMQLHARQKPLMPIP